MQHWFTLGAHNTHRHCLTHNKCTLGSYLGHLVKTSQMPSHCITHHDTPGFVAINGDNEIHVQLPNRENHLVAGWTSENLPAIHRHTISFLVWSSLSKRWESFDRLFILEMKPHQCFGGGHRAPRFRGGSFAPVGVSCLVQFHLSFSRVLVSLSCMKSV